MLVSSTIQIILNLIEENEITAYKLATDLSLGKGAISKWKSGLKPSTEAIIKISRLVTNNA